ncbi:hypothetical protein G6F59_017496 [Rhizopus arrhizus]|nr:hypothetical protein G6F59_017496 [Rhizopus arrhizus]
MTWSLASSRRSSGSPRSLRTTAFCGTSSARASVAIGSTAFRYMPGSSSTSGLANSPRTDTCPVVRSTAMSENSRRPLRFWSVPAMVREMAAPAPCPRLPSCSAARMRSMSATGWVKST